MSTITLARSDPTYYKPVKPKITITSLDGDDIYTVFDGFCTTSNSLPFIYCDYERASGETGTFNLIIEDSQGLVEKDRVHNARVYLEFGKTPDTWHTLFAGFADIMRVRRPRSFYQEILLTGPSTKIQAAELMLLIRKATDTRNNPDYSIAKLIIDMVNKRKSRPLNREDIGELTNWVVDLVSNGGGISDRFTRSYFPIVNEVLTYFWDFMERMCAMTGGNWDIEPRRFGDRFIETLTMSYPNSKHSGVTIKSADLATTFDSPTRTAYIKGAFEREDNSSIDAGVYTRVYTTSNVEDVTIFDTMDTFAGAFDTRAKAIAQQIPIENDQRRITGLDLRLAKVGEPESPKSRINGDIVMDNANTPTGTVLATFNIDLSEIHHTQGRISVDVADKLKIRFLAGSNKIWVRIFDRSGIKGDPEPNAADYIVWHHNNLFNQVTPFPQATATTTFNGGQYKLASTMTAPNWVVTSTGPVMCVEIKSHINRLQAASAPTQAEKIRWKETFKDTSFLTTDYQSVNKFLHAWLAGRSKTARSISSFLVTIPNNYFFKPYDIVSFNDSLSQTFGDLEVQRSRLVCSALPGEYQTGAFHQEVTLAGSVNELTESCSCI